MTFKPQGKHLIAGDWVASEERFFSAPVRGTVESFGVASADQIDRAVRAAEEAFGVYGWLPREQRATFLEAIAGEIEARGEQITEIACRESGLPPARLEGERGRTAGQLRLFAAHIRAGDYLDRRHDGALPERQPLPRPDIRMMQRPIGPVAVFGASNFPLAFSVAGGDTASALAAGCPVVVKGHPAHPGTSELVAEAILAAIDATGVPAGTFSLVQGNTAAVGHALVRHPLIGAVGFTGSLAAGRALFDLCAARPQPIPFFGELGSINPMFLLPAALAARSEAIGRGWAGSLAMGAGQFCTNPGVAILPAGQAGPLVAATRTALAEPAPQLMLTDGIAGACRQGADRLQAVAGVETVLKVEAEGRYGAPCLLRTSGKVWMANPELAHEVFGPVGIAVVVADEAEMMAVARSLEGQLTATLHMDEGDHPLAAQLLPVLERKAGRVLVNGFPTGVEVCSAMVHGGPYPASTNFGATSVGTLAIRRFLRPVSYQNVPASLLPADLT
ncbi:aldehyde dehydrogenase (NADP(+)) [Radicibacter daui]|uniref:aldehyde dehydrogenase (NADP(+)) n=1 Tax=Radicibacter daui TaxID=3064829 RepID=UPI004046FA8B